MKKYTRFSAAARMMDSRISCAILFKNKLFLRKLNSENAMELEMVVGLEVHAQLKTKSKIFCGCAVSFGAEPNTSICPVCMGLPGALPVLNQKCVELALIAGVALQCSIQKISRFARKNYFYPDLPKGYQITQFDEPLLKAGWLDIVGDDQTKRIRINRIHLEEDAGKLIHDQGDCSLIDLNRCGIPLIEIVSEPDVRSSQEALEFLRTLRQILLYAGVSDCCMEKGSLRCDANISVRLQGENSLGVKTELKNMNSFKNIQKALDYEFRRQRNILLHGGRIMQETFLWDETELITKPMRSKESSSEYRYFPEPDLPALSLQDSLIETIRASLPELPHARMSLFMETYGLGSKTTSLLIDNKELGDYLIECVDSYSVNPETAVHWITGELMFHMKNRKCSIHELHFTPRHMADLLCCISCHRVSVSAGKKIIEYIEEHDTDVETAVVNLSLEQLSSADDLERIVDDVLKTSSLEMERYKNGETKLMSFFMGKAMEQSKGRANPRDISNLFFVKLNKGDIFNNGENCE